MWLFHVGGFLSVVEEANDPTRLVVRARCHQHLLPVVDAIGGEIEERPERDYLFRIVADRRAFADWMRSQVLEIDYGNFKDAATRHQPVRLWADLLTRVWGAGLEFQQAVFDVLRKRKAVKQ